MVIRGFKDILEYELKDTYAPVSGLPLVRVALAIINKYDLEVYQLYVKTAFLNGKLFEEIYLEIPDGIELDKDFLKLLDETDIEVPKGSSKLAEFKKQFVCKLKKCSYGLKIGPKRWNEKITKESNKVGLEKDINEPCLFTWRKNGKMVFLIIYVDDMILVGNDKLKLDEVKSHFCKVFKMKTLGYIDTFLGIKILRNRQKKIMQLTHTEYIDKI